MKVRKFGIVVLSLLTMVNMGFTSVNASHHHKNNCERSSAIILPSKRHHHVKLVKRYKHKLLSFKQLNRAMTYDYMNDASTYKKQIRYTINKNISKYNEHQLNTILNNYDTDPDLSESLDFNNSTLNKLNNAKQNIINAKQNIINEKKLSECSNQGDSFLTQLRGYLMQDINNSRAENGVQTLKPNYLAQEGANYRVQHVQYASDNINDYKDYPHNTSDPLDNWVHGMDTNTSIGNYYATHHISYKFLGENVGDWSNRFHVYADGASSKYNNDTPEHVADNINEEVMNHDMGQGNNNGHRDIQLSPKYNRLAVSTSYNPQTQTGVFVEEFLQV